jgi:DNA-binding NtrC family response regulator
MQSAVLSETAQIPRAVVPRTILVIDDDEDYRLLVRTLLVRAGYRVLEASNGLAGLRFVAQTRVDLLITDMIMPEHEGVETILIVRHMHPQLKVVAMSGVTGCREYLDMADRLGANATLEKGVLPKLLVGTVRSLIDSRA